MHIQGEDDDGPVSYTFFSYSTKLVTTYLKSRIFANPNDEFAVLFYGTVSRCYILIALGPSMGISILIYGKCIL